MFRCLAVFSVLTLTFVAGGEQPRAAFHVEPYLQLPTPTSMTVMWETTQKLPSKVEYGPTAELGLVKEVAEPTALHQVLIDGLKPGTTYHYRVRSGELASKTHAFRTAPTPGTKKWRMALYGDSRSNPTVHRKVAEQIAKRNVDLVLHTGDIVVNGRDYASWRSQFFEPIAAIRGSVPWVSTIGNHEADSANYFSYMALPGNERHFSLDYANAHIVCLDSNGWIEKGRDSKQYQWIEEDLKKPKEATWTFIAFHHPLFSAHATRPINSLRWDWAPLFLDPACKVDGVLAGHDHFYARNYPMARIDNGANRGVLFLTSAGGGAGLYPLKNRDYIEHMKRVHHFTLFEFDGDQVSLTAIDLNGQEFDHAVLTKNPTPPDSLCAYEIEELRRFLSLALAKLEPTEVAATGSTAIQSTLEVPTRFRIPMNGKLKWRAPAGWTIKNQDQGFAIQPREPLRISLQAEVQPSGLAASPVLTVEFEAGKFRNRTIECYPFKLVGPGQLTAGKLQDAKIDGKLDESEWKTLQPVHLIASTAAAADGHPDEVRFAHDEKFLYVAAKLMDPNGKVKVLPPTDKQQSSRVVLNSEHARLEVNAGGENHVFALSTEQIRFHSRDGKEEAGEWTASASQGDGCWTVEFGIPLALIGQPSQPKINFVRRQLATKREFSLRPGYLMGQNPDIIPDWNTISIPSRFAQVHFK